MNRINFLAFGMRHCGQVMSSAGKGNQHHHKACQQMCAWSTLKIWQTAALTLTGLSTKSTKRKNGTPNHQTVETSRWTSNTLDSVPLWFFFRFQNLSSQIKFCFHLKRGFCPPEQKSSSFSPQPHKSPLILSLIQDMTDIMNATVVAPLPKTVLCWLLMH